MSNVNTVIRLTKPYTKLNDVIEFAGIYSLMLEVEGYSGPLIQVATKGGGTLDIYPMPDGTLDQQTILDFCGVEFAQISIWYDQLELDDFTQSDTGHRATIVATATETINTENGYPCAVYDNIDNHYETTGMPYADDEANVSTITLCTPDSTGANDWILGTNGTGRGVAVIQNSGDKAAQLTYRTGGTSTASGLTSMTGTHVIGTTANRTTINTYLDGVLDKTAADDNSDFNAPTNMVLGARGTGSSPFSGSVQCFAISLNDIDADTQAIISNLLKIRFNTALVNEDDFIYFSDTPVILSNGYEANGRLVGDINFTESIKVAPWKSVSQGGFGNIDIVNIDSVYDEIVSTNYNLIDIYQYDNSTLTEFGRGEIKNIAFIEKGRIRITIKSVIDKLNVELPTGRFTASDNTELENDKKPMNLGRVNLAQPILLDVATNKYFISDNLDGTFVVYDNGIQLALTTGFLETSDGFTLVNNPAGRILATVDGLTAADATGHTSTYEERISEHIPRLLEKINIEYNQTDLDALWTAHGITSSWAGKDETVLTAVNELLDGFIAYMYSDSSGELRFGTLTAPTASILTLVEREIIGDIKAFRDTAQGLSERLQNSRNYNPYTEDEIAFAATESDKINLIKEYKRTAVLTGLHPFYIDKNNVDMKSQSLGGIVNGEIILQNIIDLWSVIRYFYTISTYRVFDLNDIVNVTHVQKGLSSGKNLVVVSKKKSTKTNKITYTMWG